MSGPSAILEAQPRWLHALIKDIPQWDFGTKVWLIFKKGTDTLASRLWFYTEDAALAEISRLDFEAAVHAADPKDAGEQAKDWRPPIQMAPNPPTTSDTSAENVPGAEGHPEPEHMQSAELADGTYVVVKEPVDPVNPPQNVEQLAAVASDDAGKRGIRLRASPHPEPEPDPAPKADVVPASAELRRPTSGRRSGGPP